ncbi:adenosylcobinamide-GDP ribazoletransferase [Kurthia sibirica]|uniref:Adenosylcobinamide-GDP ribazoletransferase n=1 Tax=Kurthia sibirica TaxID=202750 RepID=A0A2U3AKX0_9BACL|nr:adenosylcobinamide-GDP ribazoletransferase [Kurthia sibirica]PWI25142.1 adenosylcobinamide-GDP ribazoletransferase [Kurthia sibirica]GEK33226.1 adenosylcobinamide-GDP ribazoletransferase [Kurthia sibirica]
MKGLLLALQFFTIIPIHKELPMTKRHITTMFCLLPYIGALIGCLAAVLWWLTENYLDFSPLLTGFLIVFFFVIMTGGLHLDGFVDMSDSYFSYRSMEKRQQILADPRIGAFGAMALLFIVLAKIIIIIELLQQQQLTWYWLLFIPFLARSGMALYLIQTPAARSDGLGAFFKGKIARSPFISMTLLSLAIGTISLIGWSENSVIPLILVGLTLAASYFFRYWTKKNFNGSSGDLFGAFIEGMEVVLWLSLLCLL